MQYFKLNTLFSQLKSIEFSIPISWKDYFHQFSELDLQSWLVLESRAIHVLVLSADSDTTLVLVLVLYADSDTARADKQC